MTRQAFCGRCLVRAPRRLGSEKKPLRDHPVCAHGQAVERESAFSGDGASVSLPAMPDSKPSARAWIAPPWPRCRRTPAVGPEGCRWMSGGVGHHAAAIPMSGVPGRDARGPARLRAAASIPDGGDRDGAVSLGRRWPCRDRGPGAGEGRVSALEEADAERRWRSLSFWASKVRTGRLWPRLIGPRSVGSVVRALAASVTSHSLEVALLELVFAGATHHRGGSSMA